METGKLIGNMEQMVNWGDGATEAEDKYGNSNTNKPSKVCVNCLESLNECNQTFLDILKMFFSLIRGDSSVLKNWIGCIRSTDLKFRVKTVDL